MELRLLTRSLFLGLSEVTQIGLEDRQYFLRGFDRQPVAPLPLYHHMTVVKDLLFFFVIDGFPKCVECSVKCKVFSEVYICGVQCTVGSLQCTVFTVQGTVNSV